MPVTINRSRDSPGERAILLIVSEKAKASVETKKPSNLGR
jgi:hypothetical protein